MQFVGALCCFLVFITLPLDIFLTTLTLTLGGFSVILLTSKEDIMWAFDYSGLPSWIKFADIACWGALMVFGFHFFTCGA